MTEDQLIDLALSRPMQDESCRPIDLHLDRKAGLHIKWADGIESDFPLVYLRKRCPCATCRTERQAAPSPSAGSGIGGGSIPLNILPMGVDRAATFVDAKLVGRYAIQVTWGDGHSTGIYDFKYLRLICPRFGLKPE